MDSRLNTTCNRSGFDRLDGPAGSTGDPPEMVPAEPLQLARAVVQVLRDASLKQRLVEGVCELLLEDARRLQERS